MAAPEVHEDAGPRTPRANRLTAFETVLIAGGLVLFLVLLYQMAAPPQTGGFLSPPLVAAAGVILLWPLRRHHTVKALLFSGGFLLLMWFFVRLSGVLLPFVVVYLLAYLFNPLVSTLRQRLRVPRWISSLLVTALVVGVVALFALLLVPNIVGELKALASRLIASLSDLRQWLATTPALDRLEEAGLINKADVNARVTAFAQEQAEKLARGIPDFVQGIFRSIGSLLGLVLTLAIMPVVLFYTLKDYPFIQHRLIQLFPTFGGRRDYLVHAGRIVGNYLRGQLTISAIAAVVVSTLLILFGVPFGLLIGLLAGLLNMIPNLGIIITNIVGVLLALVFGDPWYVDVLIVVGVLLGESLLESSVLTPNILGHHVGLHPVLILLSLFVFGYFLGIFGLLIAVPATAILMTFYKAYREELTMDLMDYQYPPRAPRRARSRETTRPETPAPPETPIEEPTPDPAGS